MKRDEPPILSIGSSRRVFSLRLLSGQGLLQRWLDPGALPALTPGPLRCKGEQPLAPTLVYCNSQMLLSVPVQTLSLFCRMCGSSCKGKPIVRVHKVVITELDLSFSYILAVWCKVKLGTIYLLQLLFWYWYFVPFPALTNHTSQ